MTSSVSVQNISVSLGRENVLDSISFASRSGEFIGLLGPNGAGKSTLLKTIVGLIRPSTGAIFSGDEILTSLSATLRARRISYLPQARPVFWSVTARSIVALGRFAYGAPLTESTIDTAAIEAALHDAAAHHLSNRQASSLSGGELARVHLARTLASDAATILADEPIAALDPAHQLAVMALLQKKAHDGRTVIAALHDLPLAAQYCDRLIVLSDGKVAADGTPAQVMTAALLNNVFQLDADITEHNGRIHLKLRPLST